jgi:hypothetical protein
MSACKRPRKQCAKCPWKVSTNPFEIPDGYDPEKHKALANTIAKPSSLEGLGDGMYIFACHETHATPCVGWLVNQLGPGNNIPLRIAVSRGRIDGNVETVGEQHETFEDTLPMGRGRGS